MTARPTSVALLPGRAGLAAAGFLSALLLAGSGWAILRAERLWFQQTPAPAPGRTLRASEKVDPNRATVGSLRRLPWIGPLRAQMIVQYRQRQGGRIAFRKASDLMNIHGIGLGTARRIAPHLALPNDLDPVGATPVQPADD